MAHVISRRGFLARTTALGLSAGAMAASRRAHAETGPPLRVGVIGVGSRGRSQSIELHRNADVARVVAVCDVNEVLRTHAQDMVRTMHGADDCAAYADFREVLARDDIDAVTIATPDHWHAPIAVAAMHAGKHVYGEKPLAYTVTEGRAMVDSARRYGVTFQHGTQQRSMPNYRIACGLVQKGRLGRVHTVRVGSPFGLRGGSLEPAPVPDFLDYDFWLGPAPERPYTPDRCDGSLGAGWYHIRDYSGGWITAWGAHDMDIAHWAIGADRGGPVEVEGWGEFAPTGLYDTAWRWRVELTYPDGAKVIYASEDENAHGVRFEGDNGWIFVNRRTLQVEPEPTLAEYAEEDYINPGRTEDHMRDFVLSCRSGLAPAAPAEVAHSTTNACHLCNLAIYLGRKIRWDAASESCVDDAEANRLLSRTMRAPWSL